MIPTSITEELKPCSEDSCVFIGSQVEGACPGKIQPCFAFGEACRLRKKYWSLTNVEIASHVALVIARGCSKKPPPPDTPEAYLRTISVNLERDLVKNDKKAKTIQEAAFEEGELADYTRLMRDNHSIDPMVAIELRDTIAFFASNLPEKTRDGHEVSTRDFYHLSVSCGLNPRDFIKRYPEITITEVKYHQAKIRETRLALSDELGL